MSKKGKIRCKNTAVKLKKKTRRSIQKNAKKWKPKSKVGRIVLKNLPFKATEEDIQKLLLEYGDLREVKLLKRPDGSPAGCGFAQFTRKESAARAIKECNSFDFMGRKIAVDWAVPKAEYVLKISSNEAVMPDNMQSIDKVLGKSETNGSSFTTEVDQGEEDTPQLKKTVKRESKKYCLNKKQAFQPSQGKLQKHPHQNGLHERGNCARNPIKEEWESGSSESENDGNNSTVSEIKTEVTNSAKQVKKKRKMEKRPKKKGRLIVRNLSFKVTEDILRDHFSKYGEITEINLLKKPDGKLVGCAFIQFERVQSAAKAILGSSGKPLIGRIVVIDWAVPHKKYVEATESEQNVEIKVEDTEQETKDVKYEVYSQDTVKDESNSESGFESDKVVKSESSNDGSEGDTASVTEDEEDESTKEKLRKPRIISNDVREGCTVFVKNVPFSATNEELKSCMEQFGPVTYALICVDPLTEHSKGTAFVKFQRKESAEECLKAGTELTLNDQTLDVFRALSRDDIQQKLSRKKDLEKKDSRNLYLVKEGVVMAGTPAAVGVSVADMSRRLQLEKWKSQILRNLNMFVSPKRLVVHNIPSSWTDSQLRKLFQNHGGEGAVITEARVMRDMKNVNADGIGKSKEYGFVSFTTHEAALQALRHINNNPSIFTPSKRPIVSFSIENKTILKAKQQRLERSRANNIHGRSPIKTGWMVGGTRKEGVREKKLKYEAKRRKKKHSIVEMNSEKKLKLENYTSPDSGTDVNEFTGVISKPGNVKLSTKFSIKKQAILHAKHVKQSKKKEQLKQRRLKQHISQEPIKQPKQKQNSRRKHKEEDKTLNKLINAYKSKLNSAADFKKWYE